MMPSQASLMTIEKKKRKGCVDSVFLVDRHSCRRRWLQVVHVDTAVLALFHHRLGAHEVCFEASSEIVHAVHRVDDGADQQHDGQHRKRCQTLAYGHVLLRSLVDAEKLEDEVGQAAKVEDDDTPRASLALVAGKVRGGEQDENRDRHGGDG